MGNKEKKKNNKEIIDHSAIFTELEALDCPFSQILQSYHTTSTKRPIALVYELNI